MATALGVHSLYAYEYDRMELAKLCQRAENDFVGVGCGLLDQFCAVFGEENCVVVTTQN